MNQIKPRAGEEGRVRKTAEAKRWLAENQAAMFAWNEHVERHGLPLAEHRPF